MNALGVEELWKPVQLGYAHVMLCDLEDEGSLRDE
jgi:hypothetical protein